MSTSRSERPERIAPLPTACVLVALALGAPTLAGAAPSSLSPQDPDPRGSTPSAADPEALPDPTEPTSAHPLPQATGTLRGEILDEAGFPALWLGVRAVDVDTGVIYTARADDDGYFLFPELPPGLYSVRADPFSNYESVPATVAVAAGETVNHTVQLELLEKVEMTIGPCGPNGIIEADVVALTRSFSRDQLQQLPSRRYAGGLLGLVPGLVVGDGLWAAGAAPDETTWTIDGMVVGDPVTNALGVSLPFEAIDTVHVTFGGYMPESGRSLGAEIDIQTDPMSSNSLVADAAVIHGFGPVGRRLDARYAADGAQLAPSDFNTGSRSTQTVGRVVGPLARNYAWLGVHYQHTDVVGEVPGASRRWSQTGHHLLTKLVVRPTVSHELSAWLAASPSTIEAPLEGVRLGGSPASALQRQLGAVGRARWRWFTGPSSNLEVAVGAQRAGFDLRGVRCPPSLVADGGCGADAGAGAHVIGPARVEAGDLSNASVVGSFGGDQRTRFVASSALTILSLEDPLGALHDLKFGVEASQTGWAATRGFPGGVLYVDGPAMPDDPSTFTNLWRVEHGEPIAFDARGDHFSAYAQDIWRVAETLSLRGGIRYDTAILRGGTEHGPIRQSAWAPRAYMSWEPGSWHRTRVVAGYGRFHDTGRLAFAAFAGTPDIGSKVWVGDGNGGDAVSSAASMVRSTPRDRGAIVHDHLQMPRSDELLLHVAHDNGSRVSVALEGQLKRTSSLFDFDDRNLIRNEHGNSVMGGRFGADRGALARLRTPVLAGRDHALVNARIAHIDPSPWFAELNATWAASRGTVARSLSGTFANAPQTRHAYGPLPETDVRFSLRGFVGVPLWVDGRHPMHLAATFFAMSGLPVERLVWSNEPAPTGAWSGRVGSRAADHRTPPLWSLGLKATQRVVLPRGEVELHVQVLNALGSRPPIGYLAPLYRDNRLLASRRAEPAQLQIGARYTLP